MSDCNIEPCKAEACKIQDCLKLNGYNESKCSKLIDNLYLCCKQHYEKHGPQQTTCCPKINLLQLKLQQRELGEIDAVLLDTKRR